MTSCEENTTGCLILADDVAGGRCTHDTILAKYQLLHAICRTDLDNELHDLGVPVAAIAADDQEAAIDTFRYGEQSAGNKGFTVVGLLEDLDLFSKPRAVRIVQLSRPNIGNRKYIHTHVPGFWSVKGVSDTSLTLMMDLTTSLRLTWNAIRRSSSRYNVRFKLQVSLEFCVEQKLIFVESFFPDLTPRYCRPIFGGAFQWPAQQGTQTRQAPFLVPSSLTLGLVFSSTTKDLVDYSFVFRRQQFRLSFFL